MSKQKTKPKKWKVGDKIPKTFDRYLAKSKESYREGSWTAVTSSGADCLGDYYKTAGEVIAFYENCTIKC